MGKALGLRKVTQGGTARVTVAWVGVVKPNRGSSAHCPPHVFHSCSASRQKALSLVSCFAGGVFLATCLLDLLPDYLAAIDEALAALHVTVSPGQLHATLYMWVSCHTSRKGGLYGSMRVSLHDCGRLLACDPMSCDF